MPEFGHALTVSNEAIFENELLASLKNTQLDEL